MTRSSHCIFVAYSHLIKQKVYFLFLNISNYLEICTKVQDDTFVLYMYIVFDFRVKDNIGPLELAS